MSLLIISLYHFLLIPCSFSWFSNNAVAVYSENFVGMISPRLSFSRDLEENETNTNLIQEFSCKLDHSPADSAFDFAFNVDSNVVSHSSTDELFSNGKILPSSVKKKEIKTCEILQQKTVTLTFCLDLPPTSETKKKSLRKFLEDSIDEEEPNNNFGTAKSFWKFRRSNSLNCDRNQRKEFIGSWKHEFEIPRSPGDCSRLFSMNLN